MPNPLRGEVSIKFADGKELILVYDYQAIANLEAHYQETMAQIVPRLDKGLDDLLVIFHAGLRARHPDISEDEAKELLRPFNLRRVAVGQAITLAYNGPDGLADEVKKKRWWW